jgi:predicted RNA-binding Zn ribbon-like protein
MPSAPTYIRQPGDRAPAPAPLSTIQDFVNTLNREAGRDELGDVDDLRTWLSRRGLIESSDVVTDHDLRDAHELRETLRAILYAHHGDELPAGARETFNRLAEDALLTTEMESSGSVGLRPARGGVAAVWARLLADIAEASRAGTWHRLKACRSAECQWAFYDHSRNRSGQWCTMKLCGARAKMRTYRGRSENR